jgi:hypothetical protein
MDVRGLELGWRRVRFKIELAQRCTHLRFLRAKPEYPLASVRNDFDGDLFAPDAERLQRVFDGGVDVIAFGFDEIHN